MMVDRLQHPLTRSEQVENDPISGESVDGSHDGRTPWQPAGLRLPRVGDRVRINAASGECQLRPCPGSYYEKVGQIGHPSYEHGLLGIVTSFSQPNADFLAAQGHTFDVLYDNGPVFAPGRRAAGGTYAAIELEILAADDGG